MPNQGKSREKAGPPEHVPSREPEKFYTQRIFRDWCKRCGICVAFCPKKVLGRDETGAPRIERPEDCIGCRFCELHCPDFAIDIHEEHTRPEGDET